MGRRTPTPEELKKLITDVMQEMGDADLACKTFDGQPNEDLSVADVLAKFRAIRSNLILSACALAGLGDVEPECIFDVDRPREEWNLLENLDLFDKRPVHPPG